MGDWSFFQSGEVFWAVAFVSPFALGVFGFFLFRAASRNLDQKERSSSFAQSSSYDLRMQRAKLEEIKKIYSQLLAKHQQGAWLFFVFGVLWLLQILLGSI